MNEVRSAKSVGLQRCPGCRYYTPKHQTSCANCGRRMAGPEPESLSVTTHDEPTVTNSDPPNRGNRGRVIAAIAVLAVALVGAGVLVSQLGGGTESAVTTVPIASSTTAAPRTTAAPTSTAATSTTADLSDDTACGRWFDLRHFAAAGLMNAPDVTNKARAIQEIAATPAVRLPATHLYEALAQKNFQGLTSAIEELNAACV